jgi:hypothetical protein
MLTRRSILCRIAAALAALPFIPRKSEAIAKTASPRPRAPWVTSSVFYVGLKCVEAYGFYTYTAISPDTGNDILPGAVFPGTLDTMHSSPARRGLVRRSPDGNYSLIWCDEMTTCVACA